MKTCYYYQNKNDMYKIQAYGQIKGNPPSRLSWEGNSICLPDSRNRHVYPVYARLKLSVFPNAAAQ